MEVLAIETNLHIQNSELKNASLIFRAINNPVRQKILRVLHENRKMTVTALYIRLCLEQSVASQHLAVLRKAGLVSATRNSQFICYSVNYHQLSRIHSIAKSLIA